MTGIVDHREGRDLWQRLKAQEAAPDAMTVAAFAEGRLGPADRQRVEAWLAYDPEAASDIAPADPSSVSAADAARLAVHAMALVAAPPGATILRFRRRMTWRWIEPTVIAASFVAVAYLGFAAGSDFSATLVSTDGAQTQGGDLFDPPTGFFISLGDASST
jgi:anti-sigma factor RsiW